MTADSDLFPGFRVFDPPGAGGMRGLSAKDLAENLYETSIGVKHRVKMSAAYHERMRDAVRIVCLGAAR
jgi:hypothetical protein